MTTKALCLEVADVKDANNWRWVLKDVHGAFLADHVVALDPAEPMYQALFNQPGYLRHYAAPDKRDEDERRLMREVGVWIGERVLGRGIGEKLLERARPLIVVRVAVPAHLERLSNFTTRGRADLRQASVAGRCCLRLRERGPATAR